MFNFHHIIKIIKYNRKVISQKYLYARWFRLGSISASNSANSFLNFDGNLSQVCDNLEQAIFERPITTAKNAFKFWYSLQLKRRKIQQ